MLVQFIEGCMSYHVSVDNKDIIGMNKEDMFNYTKQVISNLPELSSHDKLQDTDIFANAIDSLLSNCSSVIRGDEIKYGTEENEILFVNILNTKKYRIRQMYECVTDEQTTIIDDLYIWNYRFQELKQILNDVVDEYFEHPNTDDEESMSITINGMLSDLIRVFGEIHDVYRCEQCGDSVYTYELMF